MPADPTLLALATRPRPVPRRVPPHPQETLESFLQRVERANHLPFGSIESRLKRLGGNQTELLARMTRVNQNALGYAIPDLRSVDSDAGKPLEHRRSPRVALRRAACRFCASRREPTGIVTVWSDPEDVICRQHDQWLGQARSYSDQIPIGAEPAIAEANRRHRRLVADHGRGAENDLFPEAAHIIDTWHRWHMPLEPSDDRYRRLRKLRPQATHWRAWDAAYYPVIVDLFEVMLPLEPTKHEPRQSLQVVDRACKQVRDSVTGRYIPTGGFDPFLRWLNRPLRPYKVD